MVFVLHELLLVPAVHLLFQMHMDPPVLERGLDQLHAHWALIAKPTCCLFLKIVPYLWLSLVFWQLLYFSYLWEDYIKQFVISLQNA